MPARLGVRTRHVKAAKRVSTHQRSSALPVEVEVADVEALGCLVQLQPVLGVDGAGKPVLGVVGNFQRLVEVLGLDNGQDRPKDLLLGDARRRRHVSYDCRLYKVAWARAFAAP